MYSAKVWVSGCMYSGMFLYVSSLFNHSLKVQIASFASKKEEKEVWQPSWLLHVGQRRPRISCGRIVRVRTYSSDVFFFGDIFKWQHMVIIAVRVPS